MKFTSLSVVLTLGLLSLSSTAADAQLQFCNRSETRAVIVVGHQVQGHWFQSGWYTAAPNQCVTPNVVNQPLRSFTYAWYAEEAGSGGQGANWGGNYAWGCVPSIAFSGPMTSACRPGERTIGFRQIEIPRGQTSYVQYLDGASSPVPISEFQPFRLGRVNLHGELRTNGLLVYNGSVTVTARTAALRTQVRFELHDRNGRLIHSISQQRLPTACPSLDRTCPANQRGTARFNRELNVPRDIAGRTTRVTAFITGR